MSNINSSSTNSLNKDSIKQKSKSHPFWRWFWLSFLVLSLAYAWYSFYVPSNQVVWADNRETAQKMALESGKNQMYFFTGDWCVPCRIMKREIFADQEAMKVINSQIVPLMIDVDDPNAKDLIQQYNIGATPITLFTNPHGEVLDYAVGKISKEEFLDMIANLNGANSNL
ncbi:MAG: thioredoxin fold domain-containing protein [Bacteroidota bacterium]